MSDGASHGHRGVVAARERAEEKYGHLSTDEVAELQGRHHASAEGLEAQIRVLERAIDDHHRAADDLFTLYLARTKRG
jgi:hypothetical protein